MSNVLPAFNIPLVGFTKALYTILWYHLTLDHLWQLMFIHLSWQVHEGHLHILKDNVVQG